MLISGWKSCLVETRALSWKSLKSAPPSAKMTKRADLELKMLFWTNSWTLLKIIIVFRPRAARFVIFALGAPILAIFSKVHEFVQNSDFSAGWARFVISALGALLLSHFQQSVSVCTKHGFQPEISTFSHFMHWAHHFLAVFSKVREFVQNRSFQPEIRKFCHFARGAPLFSDFQQSSRVCLRQRFQPEISTFCHFRTECTTLCHLRTGYTTF